MSNIYSVVQWFILGILYLLNPQFLESEHLGYTPYPEDGKYILSSAVVYFRDTLPGESPILRIEALRVHTRKLRLPWIRVCTLSAPILFVYLKS